MLQYLRQGRRLLMWAATACLLLPVSASATVVTLKDLEYVITVVTPTGKDNPSGPKPLSEIADEATQRFRAAGERFGHLRYWIILRKIRSRQRKKRDDRGCGRRRDAV